MPDYDAREAVHLLATERLRKYPLLYNDKRTAAAEALIAATIVAARAAGFQVGKDPKDGANLIAPNPHASGAIWLVADADGVHVGYTHHGPPQRLDDPKLVYDAALDQWVGDSPDAFVSPVPGEPLARRSGVAVVAERIIEALAHLP